MNTLFTYILALQQDVSGLSIDEQVCQTHTMVDGDLVTQVSELTVKFNNGVMLHKHLERDLVHTCEAGTCSECWITYQVIAQPDSLRVTPQKNASRIHVSKHSGSKLIRYKRLSDELLMSVFQ